MVYGEMLLLSLIFGVSPVASKFAALGFSVFTVAALRVLIATIAFIPLMLIVERGFPRITRGEAGRFLVLGATGFLIFSSLYFYGLNLSPASHAVIVFGAGPIVSAVLAGFILHETLNAEKIGGIVVTVIGVAIIVLSTGANLAEGSVLGDLAFLAAISSWSVYSILAKPLIARHGAPRTTAYSVMAGTLLLTPLALWQGMSIAELTAAPIDAWLGIIFSGFISTVIAYILWNRGVQSIGPTLTMVFSNLAPVWGFVAAYFLRGEAITVLHIASGALVVGGVLLANRTGLLQAIRAR